MSDKSTTVRTKNLLRATRMALQATYFVSEELGTRLAERLFTSPRRHERPARERAILESARRFTIECELRSPRWAGARVPVVAWRWGHGPAVLLVHGWEGRGSQLAAMVPAFVEAGFSVVTFDAPGHGDSPGSRLYLTDHADCIADVAAHVGPLHAIVAHSFGAAAALLAHARHGVAAPRTVMLSPNVIIDDAVERFAKVVALDDDDRRALEDHMGAATGIGFDTLRLEHLVGERTGALLVIHDREDREVPFEHGVRLVEAWRDATIRPTEGLGHRRILRDDQVIGELVAFASIGLPIPASDLVRELDRQLS